MKPWLRILISIGLVSWVALLAGLVMAPARDDGTVSLTWDPAGGPPGGMVRVLAIDPQTPSTIYAGALNGVYKSQDTGGSWQNITDDVLRHQEISSLAFVMGQPSHIYAGGPGGLFRSVDAGLTWQRLGTGLANDLVLALATHPTRPEVIYVAVDGAIYKSVDLGERWTSMTEGNPGLRAWTLAVHPTEPNLVYAGTDAGVVVTGDDGQNWYSISAGLPDNLPVESLVIDPVDPARLYAGTREGIYRSEDGGASWVQIGEDWPRGVSSITLDPSDSRILYTNVSLTQIFKSTDGGDTWLQLSEVARGKALFSAIASPADSRQIFVAASNGVYRSSDNGLSWVPSIAGIVSTNVRYLLDVPGTKGQLFGVTRWGVYETMDGGSTWVDRSEGLDGADIVALALADASAKRLYAGSSNGQLFFSSDRGRNWARIPSPLGEDANLTGMAAMRLSTRDGAQDVLYLGTDSEGVWQSNDGGHAWYPLTGGLPSLWITTMGIVDNGNPYLFVGADRGVYRLPISQQNVEAAFERVTSQPLPGRVAIILPDVGGSGTHYVATDTGHIYRSTKTEEWEYVTLAPFAANLEVEGLVVLPRRAQMPLIGVPSNGGLLFTANEGDAWVLAQTTASEQWVARCVVSDDLDPQTWYVGTSMCGVQQGHLDVRVLWAQDPRTWGLGLILLTLIVGGLLGYRRLGESRGRPQPAEEYDWDSYEEDVAIALLKSNRVTPEMLPRIPPTLRKAAMHRYEEGHRNLDLLLHEEPPLIEPVNLLKLQSFVSNWASLVARLDNPDVAAPIAARITEQICDLLGFIPLEGRLYRSLYGYVVKAPTVRLSIPSRFPFVFILDREIGDDTVTQVRSLMSVVNITGFFAFLVVVDDDPGRRDKAHQLVRYVKGGADDLIVLDYQDLHNLFLARDAERELVDKTLSQVDLTVVSPYVVSGPVNENMFFGRDYELKAIMRTIRDHSYIIVGGRKIGKTSVLNKVLRLMDQTSGVTPLYLDCQYVTDYQGFFSSFAAKAQLPIESANPEVMRRVVLRLRRQFGGLVILLLDEVDRLLAYDAANQMRLFLAFRALSQEGLCRFVFCGERQLNAALHDSDSPLFNFGNSMVLTYLSEVDVLRMIEEPMAAMGVDFENREVLPQAIVSLSACHPNIVQEICRRIIIQVNARGDRVIRAEDIATVRNSPEFRDFFFEVTWGNATDLEKFLSVLMAAHSAFSVKDAESALALRGYRVREGAVKLALDGLALFAILKIEHHMYTWANLAFPKLLAEAQISEGLITSWVEKLLVEGIADASERPNDLERDSS